MKTRLLRKIRKKYNWNYDDIKNVWRIRDNIHMELLTEQKDIIYAIDYMSHKLVSTSQKRKWFKKIFRLYY